MTHSSTVPLLDGFLGLLFYFSRQTILFFILGPAAYILTFFTLDYAKGLFDIWYKMSKYFQGVRMMTD